MLNQHKTIIDNIAKYNKPNKLADFLIPLIGDKKKVKILDVGSGPYSVIGNYLDGIDVELVLTDNQIFDDFWIKYKAQPFLEVEWMDMENMDCSDNVFDIVTCINALDHTNNAEKAVKEMIRVCKPGSYVYIDCHLDQKNTGHKHKWNAEEDGVFSNDYDSFDLRDYGFKVTYTDNGGEKRYNKITAIFKKEEETSIPEYCAEGDEL